MLWRQLLNNDIVIGNVTIKGIPFDYFDSLELDNLTEILQTRKYNIMKEAERYKESLEEQKKRTNK